MGIIGFPLTTNASTNLDTITDFVAGTDKIQIENAVFTALATPGPLDASLLRAGAGVVTAADANDFLIYNSSTGALYYDQDGNAATYAPVQFALLGTSTHPGVTSGDFGVS